MLQAKTQSSHANTFLLRRSGHNLTTMWKLKDPTETWIEQLAVVHMVNHALNGKAQMTSTAKLPLALKVTILTAVRFIGILD